MADVVAELRANAEYWEKHNGPGTARMLLRAVDEITITRADRDGFQQRSWELADRVKELVAAEDEPRWVLADVLDHVFGRDWSAAGAADEPWRTAVRLAVRRSEPAGE